MGTTHLIPQPSGHFRDADSATSSPTRSAPPSYTTWPGRDRVERKFLLLDVGVSFGLPCWSGFRRPDGTVFELPAEAEGAWYVDLVSVEHADPGTIVVRDLFIDMMLTPGRQPRTLDLDEIADAHDAGWISTEQLLDALRRWQWFLDRYVHAARFPQAEPTDFPPAAIAPLASIPGRFGPPVSWPEPGDEGT
ncbi:hypothetical protein Bcav_3720 [Beutenbergia cavernae DSM 12333]|uniref:DUF402 domain-containing protein n=1 Tax=Beutenbergia cavernae (strain ATCC BAA-8 / DSM 12333 / CCUG 43141 / JCM 11478 / NBRC 16432 / NCIMB 13614 / HKI 0122) TaxID=471853 RepID=C5C3Q3_BEUC1|nr:DUF402 domain-containing protein [Beutenbergia cavernae]ACQ81962.1 hypothetical protein Bcav_3720 [Beutenbergia cavernae DSM 12333]